MTFQYFAGQRIGHYTDRLAQTKVLGSSGTAPEMALSYNEATNRIATAGYSYDLNGNLTALPGLALAYDVFDGAVTINGTTAKYDAFGGRIARSNAGIYGAVCTGAERGAAAGGLLVRPWAWWASPPSTCPNARMSSCVSTTRTPTGARAGRAR